MQKTFKLLFFIMFFISTANVFAEQKQFAGRISLDPQSKNQEESVMARSYIDPTMNPSVEKTVISGPSGKTCITNIASTTGGASTASIGEKYGSSNNQSQTIVIKAPIINTCK